MTVRGNYYSEASTRVLAPVVYVEKDVPDERFTIGAEYLLDAVTSASSSGIFARAACGRGRRRWSREMLSTAVRVLVAAAAFGIIYAWLLD